LNRIAKIGWNARHCQQFQLLNKLPCGQCELWSVDNAFEDHALSLPPRRFDKEILILRKQNPAQRGGPVQQFRVAPAGCADLLGGDDVHAKLSQCARDGSRHMDVKAQHSLRQEPRLQGGPCQLSGRFTPQSAVVLQLPLHLAVHLSLVVVVIR